MSILFLSTPRGYGTFKNLYDRGQDPLEPEYASFTCPTSDNPYIAPEEIEAARHDMPERLFRQEMLGEFIQDAGGVFRKVRDAVDPGRTESTPPIPGDQYSIGVDLAKYVDFTVITVLDGRGKQVHFERFHQIDTPLQMERIKAVAARYPGRVIIDSTGAGDPITSMLRNVIDITAYTFTGKTKEECINRLSVYLEHGRLRLMDIPTQEAELCAFEYSLTPSRHLVMSSPEGMHDDTVIALALAAWGLDRFSYFADPEQRRLDAIYQQSLEELEAEEEEEREDQRIFGGLY